MNILILGSTGGTGKELMKQALGLGHHVKAFARNPAEVSDLETTNLEVLQGDVLNIEDVERAVADCNAVFMAIGAGPKRTNVRERGTENVVKAMQKAGPKRFICLSSLGVGESRTNLSFFTRYIVVGIFLRHAFADHHRQEAVVRNSQLEWTIVRPPHLKDGPRTGVYKHGFPAEARDIKGWISRADLADFMLKQLEDRTYEMQAPGVSY